MKRKCFKFRRCDVLLLLLLFYILYYEGASMSKKEVCNYDKKIIFLRSKILKRLFCNENFIGRASERFEFNFHRKILMIKNMETI